MAETRSVAARVPEWLEDQARASAPELASIDLSTLVRAGLAALAGLNPREAVRVAQDAQQRRGPRKRVTA